MLKRRSVRAFKNQEIPEAVIEQLLDAANQAPSGGNIQPLSIILVRDKESRKKLAELSGGQPWVRNAPLTLIFCLDFFRINKWAELGQVDFQDMKALNHFLIAYADLMTAAQNVVILAESLGLGSVYIGSIQHEIDATRQYFEIPAYALPLMLLSLGYPKSVPQSIPKLDKKIITHYEKYQVPTPDRIRQAFDEKYGPMDQALEKYFERTYQEALEANKQAAPAILELAKREIQRLDIQNHAQFLFKVRYPAEWMSQLNQRLLQSLKNAGFDLF
jgi:FMN reductase [NAD(P)H]